MFRHHLRTALRALRRDRSYALIGGLSLAIALTGSLLVGMFVRAELSVDTFHPESDRLRAVWADMNWGVSSEPSLSTPRPLAAALEEHTAVERAVVTAPSSINIARVDGGEPVFNLSGSVVSEGYLDLFGFALLEGDRERALADPGVVLTERAAARLFGDADPMGRPVVLERWRDTLQVAVTGVLADSSGRSVVDKDADLLISLASVPDLGDRGWHATGPSTYLRLAPGRTDADLQGAFDAVAETHYGEVDDPPSFGVIPVEDLHLHELSPEMGFRGDVGLLRLFAAIAAFVLLLGVINYVNLATARAGRRAGEVGVRKSIGARRGELAVQFLAEAVTLALLAGAAALVATVALRPAFNRLFGSDLALGDLDAAFALGALGLATLTGLLAGAYPALLLSGFRPVSALKGAAGLGRASKGRFRQALVVVQLVVAVALLSASGVVLRQIAYAQTTDPGYDADGLVVVELKDRAAPWEAVADALQRLPAVEGVAGTEAYPTRAEMFYSNFLDNDTDGRQVVLRTVEGEPEYLRVLGARAVAGRLYDDRPSDRTEAVVLNEAAVRELEWGTPAQAVGRTFEFNGPPRTVIGVIQDQHMTSFSEPIDAMQVNVSQPWGDDPVRYSTLLVRIEAGRLSEGVDAVRGALTDFDMERPPTVTFLDEKVAGLYEAERRLGGVLGAFAAVAILLACLGLFGLAAYAAERRNKEIGVRRVLGASVRQIVGLLTREYVVLVAIGSSIAVPLAVIGVRRWLDGFAYHIELGPGLFVGAVALLLGMTLLVVSGQALRAARRNPTSALRTD